MSREKQFQNFPKDHIINLMCDMTDLFHESEAKLAIAVEALREIAHSDGDRSILSLEYEARDALTKIEAR